MGNRIRVTETYLYKVKRRADVVLCIVFIVMLCRIMPAKAASLLFEKRVQCQTAIENVYGKHRIWPKENPHPKPALESMLSKDAIRAKVSDTLRKSNALEFYGHRPITGEQLQAEMERMARNTKDPIILKELWFALDNDPYLIAECLARPVVSNRLIRNWFEQDTRLSEQGRGTAKMNSFDRWWLAAKQQFNDTISEPVFIYVLPVHINLVCAEDTWSSISGPPDPRLLHTAVWTGSEMIIWGGEGGLDSLLNSGGRYNPATDTWTSTSRINAPMEQTRHTAVWTGTEMIVWGGTDNSTSLNTGSKYNPLSDTWNPISTNNAPAGRWNHTAIWTGTEMIIWGGINSSYLNSGGRYNPATDSWTTTTGTNAPSGREYQTAVWTGSEMIIWGGSYSDTSEHILNTGSRYNPVYDSWSATSLPDAPSARKYHTAVWTGTEMIVWGGYNPSSIPNHFNTGARYNPTSNSWIPTATTDTPSGRSGHAAVWSGSRMIIWGGSVQGYINTGGRYDPLSDSWTPTTQDNAPSARRWHSTIWTGTEMIIWGGNQTGGSYYLNTGGRYNPSTDLWVSTSMNGAPVPRVSHTAVWTGVEMIIWGGELFPGRTNTGSAYNLALDLWTPVSLTNAPSARANHSAVWTGKEIIIWGGVGTDYFNDGSRYNPATDSWTATTMIGAPALRVFHASVWTGTEMIIWGGQNIHGIHLNTGGRYNPNSNSWVPTTTVNVPDGRIAFTAIWSGSEMIIWGGYTDGDVLINSGGKYNPATDSWIATSLTGVPSARQNHIAVWTGTEMIIWGGEQYFSIDATGGRYNPLTDSWLPVSTTNAPNPGISNSAVWSGTEMIIWAGDTIFNNGGKYAPATDTWAPISIINAPFARYLHTAIWSNTGMIIWGGYNYGLLNSGGFYCTPGPCLVSYKPVVDDSSSSMPNGIIEENENVVLRSSLTNVCATTVTSVSGQSATPDAIIINNATAAYPDIAPGETQNCTTCYSITAPAVNRPTTHWDITIIETPDCGSGCILNSYYFIYHIGNSFADVPPSHFFYSSIEKIFHSGITGGCTEHTYCPVAIVNREQLAKLVCSAMNSSSSDSCTVSGCTGVFTDVSSSNMFCPYIEALFNTGVVSGCQSNPLAYCPGNITQRQAMAKIICLGMNATDPGSCVPGSCTGIFNDVPSSNPFCAHIEALWNAGVISGCSPSMYCPAGNVTRAQMAKFLVNGFGLAL